VNKEIFMDEVTIFDKILAKEIPADCVYEDEDVFAFSDIDPQAPVHVLVIPKIKIVRFSELKNRQPEDIGIFFKKVSKVAAELGLDVEGYRVVINNGKHGQQTVEYLHAHILGGRQLHWPPG
jgi:histidine triad (HIT) family protein